MKTCAPWSKRIRKESFIPGPRKCIFTATSSDCSAAHTDDPVHVCVTSNPGYISATRLVLNPQFFCRILPYSNRIIYSADTEKDKDGKDVSHNFILDPVTKEQVQLPGK